MALIDKILGRNKTLSELSPQELRKEEILLGKQREKLLKKVSDLAAAKQKIFSQGAEQKSPEVRKALAMDFEMKTQEQVLAARELTVRGKELLTVSRLRLIKESHTKGKALGRLKLTAKDVARISGWIENHQVREEEYTHQLDMLLELGSDSDTDALRSAGLTAAGEEVMGLWDQLDRGKVKPQAAYDQADQAVRRKAERQG